MGVTAQLTGEGGTAAAYLAEMEWYRESYEKAYYPVLEGLKINAIGDSYIAPQEDLDKWPVLLTKKYDLTMNNYGIGGSTVSNFVTERNPMCIRYTSMKNNDPDIVIIEGGRNDFNNKVPIGAVDSKDTTTYSGALNTIIDGLQARYPNAMFVLISVWNFPDKPELELTHKDYVDAMDAVAKAQGAYFFRSSDVSLSGVDMRDSAFRAQYCVAPDDVSHLNEAGMKYFFPQIEKELAKYYTDFLANKK